PGTEELERHHGQQQPPFARQGLPERREGGRAGQGALGHRPRANQRPPTLARRFRPTSYGQCYGDVWRPGRGASSAADHIRHTSPSGCGTSDDAPASRRRCARPGVRDALPPLVSAAMKRLAVTLAGLVVLAIAVLWPALRYDSGGPGATDTPTISRYLADFTVADNGDLTATETLTVTFPDSGKHGIFRFFDRSDPSAPHARRDPHDISVSMDGAPVPVDLSTQASGRYVVARIGDPDVTVAPGDHTYVIRYRIDGVLEPGTDGAPTQFYW